jgi:hypothetical protein
MEVYLYVYDLSQGMARQLSLALTGKQIDGIYHTAVVVGNVEYAFGQGVEEFEVGKTPYGFPIERILMGNTMLPIEIIREYMEEMKSVWTADKYHLLDNNCSNLLFKRFLL